MTKHVSNRMYAVYSRCHQFLLANNSNRLYSKVKKLNKTARPQKDSLIESVYIYIWEPFETPV